MNNATTRAKAIAQIAMGQVSADASNDATSQLMQIALNAFLKHSDKDSSFPIDTTGSIGETIDKIQAFIVGYIAALMDWRDVDRNFIEAMNLISLMKRKETH